MSRIEWWMNRAPLSDDDIREGVAAARRYLERSTPEMAVETERLIVALADRLAMATSQPPNQTDDLAAMPPNQTPPSEMKTEQKLRRAAEEVTAWRRQVAMLVSQRAMYGDDHKRTIEAMDALDDALEGFDPARYESARDVPGCERYARLPTAPPNQTDDLPEGIVCVFVRNLEVHGLRADGTEVRIRRGG